MLNSFEEIKKQIKAGIRGGGSCKKVVVVSAEDEEVLQALRAAKDEGIADGILIGDDCAIREIASKHHISLDGLEIIHEPSQAKAGELGCTLVREARAQVIMKGLLDTSKFMQAILNKEKGLNSMGNLISHVALFELQSYSKLLLVTDAAINIAPDLQQKSKIISNAVKVAQFLGREKPLVACCCAVEKVNAGMPATVDAALLSKMSERGQIEGNCIVDGPLAYDNAISEESARIKKISSPVAGKADIILCNDIESANYLYKSLIFSANAAAGAIVMGASAPVVLTSRADSHSNKFLSIVLAVLAADNRK
ncbi:MAG: bifunctional enoyl-CoA hydratase/phosphate acetyltransferase [Oligoflexia bacterium]|nr:bifunctional enoyl-CoA hydratase/phosphate acetyltransferase [Oligoflexia bacterium]MBF0365722.1 bifunctional enoyl-CoA hydratase/phosphate acetyltransferase [Oligoflexia bacterium]